MLSKPVLQVLQGALQCNSRWLPPEPQQMGTIMVARRLEWAPIIRAEQLSLMPDSPAAARQLTGHTLSAAAQSQTGQAPVQADTKCRLPRWLTCPSSLCYTP